MLLARFGSGSTGCCCCCLPLGAWALAPLQGAAIGDILQFARWCCRRGPRYATRLYHVTLVLTFICYSHPMAKRASAPTEQIKCILAASCEHANKIFGNVKSPTFLRINTYKWFIQNDWNILEYFSIILKIKVKVKATDGLYWSLVRVDVWDWCEVSCVNWVSKIQSISVGFVRFGSMQMNCGSLCVEGIGVKCVGLGCVVWI